MRLRSPESLIRDLWDAIADLIARSPAAPMATASPAFAAAEPSPVGDLADWLADTTDGLAAGARLGLRIEPVPSPAMDARRHHGRGGIDEPRAVLMVPNRRSGWCCSCAATPIRA